MVAPLAGDVLRPAPEAAVVHEAAADAGAENHPEHHCVPLPCTRVRLRERKAVGIVLEQHAEAEPALQVRVQGTAVQADGVRVLERAVARRERPGRADAHHVAPRRRRPERFDETRHPLDDVLVPALALGRDAAARQRHEIVAEHHPLDLRPPEVDADDHGSVYHTRRDPMYGRRWRIACRTPKAA